MKTLIILKGLVKKDKLDWVKNQGLELFFLDYSTIRKLYSAPELLTPNKNILNFSFSDIVYRRFMEILCYRLSKGCMVVIDIESLSYNLVETLATIYGYSIFWVVNEIPKDYIKNVSKYADSQYPIKPKLELKKEIQNYNNSIERLESGNIITSFNQVEEYWTKQAAKNNKKKLHSPYKITHVSDLHSHKAIFDDINFSNSDINIIYGDYIDGPIKGGSREMLDYALGCEDPKFIWLEGNHELRLRKYLGSVYFQNIKKPFISEMLLAGIPLDFFETTAKEFEDIKPEEILDYLRRMNEKLKLFYILQQEGTNYICTHSGFRYLDQITPKFIGNVVYGTRNIDKVDRTFSEKTSKGGKNWSIHAHCKYPVWETSKYPYVMNIDPLDDKEVVVLKQTQKEWKICKLREEE